jgi:hypothetical protein
MSGRNAETDLRGLRKVLTPPNKRPSRELKSTGFQVGVLGSHASWTASQPRQAAFATCNLRIFKQRALFHFHRFEAAEFGFALVSQDFGANPLLRTSNRPPP